MKAYSQTIHRHQLTRSRGFTLVELLVVITIITILAGIAVPAITRAVETARVGAVRTEVEGLNSAVARYKNKYTDYPPDFMDWNIVARHYRKAFPNIAAGELALLQRAVDLSDPNDADATIPIAPHNPAKMDRAEALYWSLGGFSSDPQFPFTGPGGPLVLIPGLDPTLPASYQVNTGRDNTLFDFEPGGLTISTPNAGAVLSASNRAISTDEVGIAPDLFPIYLNSKDGPYVYFDSRTYDAWVNLGGTPLDGFNGYGHPTYGVVRPFVSDQPNVKTDTNTYADNSGSPMDAYRSAAHALTAWQFINPDSFQIISAGLDSSFGPISFAQFDADSSGTADPWEPMYIQYPSGKAIVANGAGTAPNDLLIPRFERFQYQADRNLDVEGQIDNITNFSVGKIVDDLKD